MSYDIPKGMMPPRDLTANVVALVEDAPLLDFEQFLLTETSEEMEKRMMADVFLMGRMAIMGQMTAFYGGYNAGKTLIGLRLIVDAIESGAVSGESVYYVNADDTYKGIVTKKRLCEKHGFKMLVPGMHGFKASMLVEVLRNRAATDTANGCIVILDTLKKFADLMDKKASSAFGDVQRGFIARGGTVVAYAHVNKAKGDEGESIHAGTTDIIDDADCAYILDVLEDDGDIKTVKFRNIKDRGAVHQVVSYQYKSKGNDPSVSYMELFHSVQEVDAGTAKKAQDRAHVATLLAMNHDTIIAVMEAIRGGEKTKTGLVAVLMLRGLSRAKANKLLDTHMGTDKDAGHRWNAIKGADRNVYTYSVI